MDEPTPILRADATDDELYEPVTTLTGTELSKFHGAEETEKDAPPEEPATVDAEPVKRLVPVVVDGVFHGMREE